MQTRLQHLAFLNWDGGIHSYLIGACKTKGRQKRRRHAHNFYFFRARCTREALEDGDLRLTLPYSSSARPTIQRSLQDQNTSPIAHPIERNRITSECTPPPSSSSHETLKAIGHSQSLCSYLFEFQRLTNWVRS